MKVADRMVRGVITLDENQMLHDALVLFQKHRLRHVPVLAGGRLVGMLTDRDVKRASPSAFSGADQETFEKFVHTTKIAQIMTRNPFSVTPSTPLKEAVKVLHDRKFGALPVVEGDRLVGILTATDMLKDLYDLLPD